jgi:hypothetical protein
MPYHNFEAAPSEYFAQKKKNNLNKWEKIEQKREEDLQTFLKQCVNKNEVILQNTKPIQHEMIHKN